MKEYANINSKSLKEESVKFHANNNSDYKKYYRLTNDKSISNKLKYEVVEGITLD